MPKAIVVDDSRAVRMLVARALAGIGFEVREAANGAEALDVLAAEPGSPVDVALVDWNMPVMNGLDLVKKLRSERRYDSLRIVMVTTETEIEQMLAALDAGANEYVMKPFTREILVEKLQMAGVGA